MNARVAVVAAVVSSIGAGGCAAQRQAQAPSVPKPPVPSASTTASSGSPGASSPKATAPAAGSTRGESGEPSDRKTGGPSADPAGAGQKAGGQAADAHEDRGTPAGGAKTPDEQRETLDRRLDASLSEFDALLLKEQQAVAAKRAEEAGSRGSGSSASGEGEGGAGSAGRASGGGASGQKAGTASEKKSGGRERQTAGTRDRSTGSSEGGSREGDARETTSPPEGSPGGTGAPSVVPVDVGDGKDDDVVARQLREAAMKEQDPAIREKLWDEYRRYKRGS